MLRRVWFSGVLQSLLATAPLLPAAAFPPCYGGKMVVLAVPGVFSRGGLEGRSGTALPRRREMEYQTERWGVPSLPTVKMPRGRYRERGWPPADSRGTSLPPSHPPIPGFPGKTLVSVPSVRSPGRAAATNGGSGHCPNGGLQEGAALCVLLLAPRLRSIRMHAFPNGCLFNFKFIIFVACEATGPGEEANTWSTLSSRLLEAAPAAGSPCTSASPAGRGPRGEPQRAHPASGQRSFPSIGEIKPRGGQLDVRSAHPSGQGTLQGSVYCRPAAFPALPAKGRRGSAAEGRRAARGCSL